MCGSMYSRWELKEIWEYVKKHNIARFVFNFSPYYTASFSPVFTY